ncbi:helix-turn-helix domain-containing protein [Streptomyces sp. NPDC088921]|uniref:TetR/AcrR family transcriptional regulator n=1 Tax=unclassified Streptomyces TaxID=2593676 RepID=UPI00343D7CC0
MARQDLDTAAPSLRDRKRERTRRALIDAAADLFERKGYDETTVAEIAAAAEIGTRTFFGYFASKEDILFPDSDARARTTIEAIAGRGPAEGPVDVLVRALENVTETDADMVGPMAAVRMRLFRTVPAVRGKALQIQMDAQREIARELHAAFPDELDRVSAAALAGALTGAVSGALDALMEDEGDAADGVAPSPVQLRARVREATELALRPWREGGR